MSTIWFGTEHIVAEEAAFPASSQKARSLHVSVAMLSPRMATVVAMPELPDEATYVICEIDEKISHFHSLTSFPSFSACFPNVHCAAFRTCRICESAIFGQRMKTAVRIPFAS